MKQTIDCERERFDRLIKYQLPHQWKLIGLAFTLLFIIVLFVLPSEGNGMFYAKEGMRKLILLSLLAVVLAKEKLEDERIESIRLKSFKFSFTWAVLYAVFQPLAYVVVSRFIPFEDLESFVILSSFQVLFAVLIIQIGSFHLLKNYSE